MIVDLIAIKNSAAAFDYKIAPSDIDLESETVKVSDAVRVRGNVKQKIAQTNVEGTIRTKIEVECSRCLQPVEKPLDIEFRAAFVTPEFYTQEREAELNPDDLEVSIYEGDRIDMTELVREQILLNAPEAVFCREDCQGLCQKCGANRNLINCRCEETEADPRWAALKNLK